MAQIAFNPAKDSRSAISTAHDYIGSTAKTPMCSESRACH
jgi:hypothetical protein